MAYAWVLPVSSVGIALVATLFATRLCGFKSFPAYLPVELFTRCPDTPQMSRSQAAWNSPCEERSRPMRRRHSFLIVEAEVRSDSVSASFPNQAMIQCSATDDPMVGKA